MAGSTGDRLQAGILAARQGHNQEAKELLASVVVADPNSELAWLWLGKILSSPDQCAECFRRALAINPENKEAQQALMDLIRPDLSFMPKTPAAGSGTQPPATTPSQVFTADTADGPPFPQSGVTADAGDRNAAPPVPEGLSPFENSAFQIETDPTQAAPPAPVSAAPYVPPFDEPIGEGEDELSPADRAALAAEADQRVMGKPPEAEQPAVIPSEIPSPEDPLQPPFPGFVEPVQPPQKANGLIFAVCGFFLALLFLGFPAYLLSKDGDTLNNLASIIQPPPSPAQAVAQLPTSTPGSTAVPSTSPGKPSEASPIPAIAASFTPEPTQSFSHRLESVHAEILRGQNLIQSEKFADAVLVWNNVLAVVPEDGDSHYQRGVAYLDLAELPPRGVEEYKGYLAQARSDLDQAIAIGPVKGEYYLARHKDLIRLAFLEPDRSKRSPLLELALADAQNALKLGILFEKGLDRRPGDAFLGMEKCDQALNFLLALKPGKTELADVVGDKIDLARAYLCLGQVDLAWDQVRAAENLNPGNRIYWIKALTLYNQGLPQDALTVLNEWIKREPYASSPRYALRALIHYDLGQIDKAGADLVAAGNEGFDFTGIATYVTARLAIDSGNLPAAGDLLIQADTYVSPDLGLIARRIHQDYRRVKGQLPQTAPSP